MLMHMVILGATVTNGRSQGPAAAADLLEGVGGEFLSSEESGRNNRLVSLSLSSVLNNGIIPGSAMLCSTDFSS